MYRRAEYLGPVVRLRLFQSLRDEGLSRYARSRVEPYRARDLAALSEPPARE